MNIHLRWARLLLVACLMTMASCDVAETDQTAPSAEEKPGDNSAPDATGTRAEETTEPELADPLQGEPWLLFSLVNASGTEMASENIEVTALFSGNTVSGSAGCNSYSATYEVDGDQIQVEQPVSTRKFCNATGVMELEEAFLAGLAAATEFQVEEEELTIMDGEGLVLRFRRQQTPEAAD